ncbi:hypothetical protein [Nocardioides sp. MH1]|uniref:hypothetical protein n=1 Tax=Nocardioides sp. MH1 TaxID=3242490 RepID=UPI0035216C37
MAYLDETYSLEAGRRRFYVMAAVVVLPTDLDPLRNELDNLVPDGWWHTTEVLQAADGRTRTRELLRTFRTPDETCIVVDKVAVADHDKEGFQAREAVLRRLLTVLHTPEGGVHPPVRLVITEEQREARKNNWDRSVRKALIEDQAIGADMNMVHASPGSEHLLWLPDLVCSAYRQKALHQRGDLFNEIEDLTRVIELP